MKKLVSLLVALCLALCCVCGVCAEDKKNYKIGIVLMIENGAFLDMKAGVIKGLKDLGYVEGDNLTIDYQCAQGDATNLQTICQNMADGSYDLVITVATPPTQAFVGLESETPCVFCSVAAPVVAGVMSALDTPDMNATGTSNAIPAGDIISLGLQITPDVKTFGLVYATSEVNAVNAMNNAKEFLAANGYRYIEKTVTNSGEVQTAAQAVLDQGADVVFVANDSVVQAAVDILAELCIEAGVPTYCCSATTVLSGCLATLAMSDEFIGIETAGIAAKVLSGTPISEIPAIVVPADIVSVNSDTLAALGLTLPDSVLEMGEVQYLPAK
ncbi:MAG: ABC transporter substrate-binding protein [Clostridia bacterium]|nr:ABC transporter substrate-binding protein [Clostridia bacterium]